MAMLYCANGRQFWFLSIITVKVAEHKIYWIAYIVGVFYLRLPLSALFYYLVSLLAPIKRKKSSPLLEHRLFDFYNSA